MALPSSSDAKILDKLSLILHPESPSDGYTAAELLIGAFGQKSNEFPIMKDLTNGYQEPNLK